MLFFIVLLDVKSNTKYLKKKQRNKSKPGSSNDILKEKHNSFRHRCSFEKIRPANLILMSVFLINTTTKV